MINSDHISFYEPSIRTWYYPTFNSEEFKINTYFSQFSFNKSPLYNYLILN